MVHLFYTFCGYLFIKKKFLIVYKFVHLIFKFQYLREKLDWCLILHLHRHFQVIKEAISHGACMDPPTNLAFMTLIWGLKHHRTSFASAYGNGAIHIILLRTKMLQSPLHPSPQTQTRTHTYSFHRGLSALLLGKEIALENQTTLFLFIATCKRRMKCCRPE